MRRIVLGALLAAAASPALANDSTAELGTGGLILSRSDVIWMEKENLSISMDKVTVDYVFRNQSDKDVETIVAFPMPDIEANEFYSIGIPQGTGDNFLGFTVKVDGKSVKPELEHKAMAVGIDVSKDLAAHNIPFFPFTEATYKALETLPEDVASDWRDRGIIQTIEYDDGSGMKEHRSPYWQLKSAYWWKAKFPANTQVKVAHEYQPSVGGTAGLTFFFDGEFQANYERYKLKYCIDRNVERAILKAAQANPDGYPQLTEARLSYVLTTGGNWATGTIGDFTLTIDKGRPDYIVSFCGTGVKKTGPTTFQMKATDYYPEHDVDVLILQPYSFDAPAQAPKGSASDVPAARKAAGRKPAAAQ